MKRYARGATNTPPSDPNLRGTERTQEMGRLQQLIDVMNRTTFNPVGLNIVWPKNVGFIFVRDGPPVANAIGR